MSDPFAACVGAVGGGVKYCVTGGAGVIASLFAKSKIASGAAVQIIDDGLDLRHEMNLGELRRETHRLGSDIFGSNISVGSADRILHAAASTGIPYSGKAPLDDWSRNVDGTIEVLQAVRTTPRPTVVLSSVKPIGLGKLFSMEWHDHFALSGYGVDESFILSPDEIYAASKAAQSLVCQAYARTFDLPIVVFRCSNLFGPAAPHGKRHGWLTNFCIRAALGWTIEIQGSGKQTRDMLFATDVESAAMLAFAALESNDVERGRIFNLGGGPANTISVLQAVAMLRGLGATFETKQAEGRKNEDMLFVTDCSAIQRDLGWERTVSVLEGVTRVYEWAKTNRDELGEIYKAER